MTHPRALEAAAIEGSDAFKAALRVMIERDPTRVPAAAVLRDAIAAYLAEAGDGWRDIETAPKGEVLLYFPKVVTGAHRQSILPPMYRVGRVSDTPNRRPTHWMPLPAPPAPQEPRP